MALVVRTRVASGVKRSGVGPDVAGNSPHSSPLRPSKISIPPPLWSPGSRSLEAIHLPPSEITSTRKEWGLPPCTTSVGAAWDGETNVHSASSKQESGNFIISLILPCGPSPATRKGRSPG